MGPLKNHRQELYCQEIVSGKSQSEAYRLAGYKHDAGAASRLSANVNVVARIAELLKPVFDRYAITTDRIQREMALSAFARMKHYEKFITSGSWDDVTEEESAAIGEVTTRRTRTEAGVEVVDLKFKLADKHQSLVALAKIRGLMKEGGSEPMQVIFNVHRTERSKGKRE